MYLISLLLSLSCQPDKTPEAPLPNHLQFSSKGSCNPIDDGHCLLPFPSDYYRNTETFDTPFLDIPAQAMPINVDGIQLDPKYFAELNGFSIGSTIYLSLPGSSSEGTLQWPSLSGFEDADAKTIIIDSVSRARVPHTVERETRAEANGQDLLMLRPMMPLEHGQTYIVGVRNLVGENNQIISTPSGFAALRDNETEEFDLLIQQDTYEDLIFPILIDEGFDREDLQMALSFTTATQDHALRRIQSMRDHTITKLETNPITYTIDEITTENCETGQGRVVRGQFEAPVFLTEHTLGTILTRDSDGLPYENGTAFLPFMAVVGCSLIENQEAGQLVQYGHGLFGSRLEVDSSNYHQLANDHGWVMFSADWTGMMSLDVPALTLNLISDPSLFVAIPERTLQGWIEGIVLSTLMRQSNLGQEEAFSSQSTSLIDPQHLYFYGNSMGAALGGGYSAMHPDIHRVVLGVGGMPFSLLLTRAIGFEPFLSIMETMYSDWRDITLIMGLFQQLWDPAESIGWAHLQDKDVLLQIAIGDPSVPSMGGHMMARAYGATLVEPYNREIWGVPSAQTPFTGSAITEWDYGLEDSIEAIPVEIEDLDPHNEPRASQAGMQQLGEFINTGIINHYCDGPCDFE